MISNIQRCPKMHGTCPRQKENFLDNVWKRYIEVNRYRKHSSQPQ